MKHDKLSEIVRCCALCESAAPLHLTDQVLCSRRGVVASDHLCHRFSYDPLKREPTQLPKPELTFVDVEAPEETPDKPDTEAHE